MAHITWTENLNTGIEVIDDQHRRIVDFINQLHDTRLSTDRSVVGHVIIAMVDYTISHFGFEESLMEEAGYEFTRAHKKVHELFIKRVNEMQQRYDKGEDILDELEGLLTRWLLNHIKHDDASYVDTVKPRVHAHIQENVEKGWMSRTLGLFFRSA